MPGTEVSHWMKSDNFIEGSWGYDQKGFAVTEKSALINLSASSVYNYTAWEFGMQMRKCWLFKYLHLLINTLGLSGAGSRQGTAHTVPAG